MAFDLGTLLAKLGLDTSQFEKGMADADKSMNKLTDGASKVSNAMVAIGTGAAAVGLAKTVEGWVRAADEAAVSFGMLELAIKRAGSDASARGIAEFSKQLMVTANMEDEAAMGAAAMLVKFGANEEQIKKLLPLIADMGAQSHNYEGAAMAIGRALTGQTRGLVQYGVILDEDTKKLMDNMSESEKFAFLLDKIGAKVTGNAELVRNSWGGARDQIKIQAGEMAEALGDIFKDDFIEQANNAAAAMKSIAEAMAGAPQIVKTGVEFSVLVGGAALTGAALAKFLSLLGVGVGVAGGVALGVGAGVAIAADQAAQAGDRALGFGTREDRMRIQGDAEQRFFKFVWENGGFANVAEKIGKAYDSVKLGFDKSVLGQGKNWRDPSQYVSPYSSEYGDAGGNALFGDLASMWDRNEGPETWSGDAGAAIKAEADAKKKSVSDNRRAQDALDKWVLDQQRTTADAMANRAAQYADAEQKAMQDAYDADYAMYQQREKDAADLQATIDAATAKERAAIEAFNSSILSTLQGGGIGGIAGAAGAVQFGAAAVGPIGQIVDAVEGLFSNIASTISGVADSIGGLASEVLGGLPLGQGGQFAGKAAGRFAGAYESFFGAGGNFLSSAMSFDPMKMASGGAAFALAGPKLSADLYAAGAAAFADLVSQTEAYSRVQAASERLWGKLVSAIEPATYQVDALVGMIEVFGDALQAVIAPFFGDADLAETAFNGLLTAVHFVAGAFLQANSVITGFAMGVGQFVIALMENIATSWMFSDAQREAAHGFTDSATVANYNANVARDAWENMDPRTFADIGRNADRADEGLGALANELQKSVTNIPEWYHIQQAMENAGRGGGGASLFEGNLSADLASTPGGNVGGGRGGRRGVTGTGGVAVGNGSPRPGEPLQERGDIFNIAGDLIVQTDDPDRVGQAIQRKREMGSYINTGSAYAAAMPGRNG